MTRLLPLLVLAACVEDASVPYVGDCALYPEGTYEYGQLGIGTCLSGPVALQWLSDGHTLAVSNANPYVDFEGGSVLLLDMERLDEGSGRNLVTSLATGALDMPMFNADMARIEGTDILAVTNRFSDDARTREATDSLFFVDASDPSAPVLDTLLAPDGGALGVGYDPNTILQDPLSGYLFVVNRTSHEVAMVDVASTPAALVSAGGPSRLLPDGFVDADASGSRAAFVTLEIDEPELLDGREWALSWNVGSIRAWVPGLSGARRVTGNGETVWTEAPNGRDLDLTETDLVSQVIDPAYGWGYDDSGRAVGRMVFTDQGYVRDAQAYNNVTWSFGDSVLLGPDETLGEAVIGGPQLLAQDGVWYLFYDGGTGSRQSLRLATSLDGTTFERVGEMLVPPDGVSYEDPHIVADPWSDQWRMWFTRVEGDDWSIAEAVSDDLLTWTLLPGAFTTDSGAATPSVGYWGGRFHLLFVRNELPQYAYEVQSLDGTHWGEARRAFSMDVLPADPRPGLAIDPLPEDTFGIDDGSGTPYGTLEPGELVRNGENGWNLRLAAGMWIDPSDFGDVAAGGIQVDSVLTGDDGVTTLFLTLRDDAGVYSIGRAEIDGDELSVSLTPVLEAGASGGFDAEGVYAPVVVADGDGFVMFYAGLSEGRTAIGRATSADGLTWTADNAAVLDPELEFEAVAVEPGSVIVDDDGGVRMFYTGYDGGSWRIGEAEGALTGGPLTRVPGLDGDWSFDVGAPGDWHDEGVARPSVLVADGVERMWFEGFDGDVRRIGYAERTTGGEWAVALDPEESPRAVLSGGSIASFGVDGVARPVATPGVDGREDGWTLWYAGIDDGITRVGRAVTTSPDRVWVDQRLPTLADTWGFTAIPEREEDTISLDGVVGTQIYSGRACTGMVTDELRGFLYVTCKETRNLFVVDVRDDSDGEFQDLNYLSVEAVVPYESTSAKVGMRGGILDPTRPWLWGLTRGPEALVAIDLSNIADNAEVEILEGEVVAVLPLPRRERDAGVETTANVGPGGLVLHPDQRHLFVTNFDHNSVSCYDLGVGAPATLVAEATDIGENPYAVTVSPDGSRLVVGNYLGEVDGGAISSTLVVLDADPTSATFMDPITWVVNK